MRAAAYAIARQTRELHPAAARVHLEGSDQGDWLDVTGWDSGGGGVGLRTDLPEDVAFAAAGTFYIPHIGNDEQIGAVPGLWCTDRRRGIFVLDIERVLSVCGTRTRPSSRRWSPVTRTGRTTSTRPPSWV